jgi:hypothetical protein
MSFDRWKEQTFNTEGFAIIEFLYGKAALDEELRRLYAKYLVGALFGL